MCDVEVDISENPNTSSHHDWSTASSSPVLSIQQTSTAPPQPCPPPQDEALPQTPSSALPRPETDSSCMEVEAAQRKLQEIEDRWAV